MGLTIHSLLRFCLSHLPPSPRRSPLLACICGACRIARSCTTAYQLVFEGLSTTEELDDITRGVAVSALIILPTLWIGNGALVAWVIRLLVLYDPQKRKAWGRYFKEKRVARALCWTYAIMEAAFCVGASVYGLKRCLRYCSRCISLLPGRCKHGIEPPGVVGSGKCFRSLGASKFFKAWPV